MPSNVLSATNARSIAAEPSRRILWNVLCIWQKRPIFRCPVRCLGHRESPWPAWHCVSRHREVELSHGKSSTCAHCSQPCSLTAYGFCQVRPKSGACTIPSRGVFVSSWIALRIPTRLAPRPDSLRYHPRDQRPSYSRKSRRARRDSRR